MKNDDIAFKIVELYLAEKYAEKIGQAIHIPVGSFGCWDGKSTSDSFTYEAKLDLMARKTGNLAIEVSYCGHDSGLTSTKADTWVEMIPIDRTTLEVSEYSVDTLRRVLKDFPIYTGGDGDKSHIKLLPRQMAEKLAIGTFTLSIDWNSIRPSWN